MTAVTPHSVWQGSFFLYGVEIKCHTLEDGQRIIEEGCFERLLDVLAAYKSAAVVPSGAATESAMADFVRWLNGTG